jgi:hypothetical protein
MLLKRKKKKKGGEEDKLAPCVNVEELNKSEEWNKS